MANIDVGERSIGNTCYLRCYIINMLTVEDDYDTIGFQSPSLDDVFRYSYKYLDMVRARINLAVEPNCSHLKMFAEDGKMWLTDEADTKQLLRLIEKLMPYLI